jgi:hypothetical protein
MQVARSVEERPFRAALRGYRNPGFSPGAKDVVYTKCKTALVANEREEREPKILSLYIRVFRVDSRLLILNLRPSAGIG